VWVNPECGYSPMGETTLSTGKADHVIPASPNCYIERAESATFYLRIYLVTISRMSTALKRYMYNGKLKLNSIDYY
jgi:hypothetical protein